MRVRTGLRGWRADPHIPPQGARRLLRTWQPSMGGAPLTLSRTLAGLAQPQPQFCRQRHEDNVSRHAWGL